MSVEAKNISQKHVILEVGIGEEPFPVSGLRRITGNQHYIGIDRWKDVCKIAKRNIQETPRSHTGRLDIVVGNGTQLPLPTASVSEVVFSNVFGATSYASDTPVMVREAHRVLRSDGIVTIVETTSPDATSPRKINSTMEASGFEFKNRTRDTQVVGQYKHQRRTKSEVASGSYVATFSKKTKRTIANVLNLFLLTLQLKPFSMKRL